MLDRLDDLKHEVIDQLPGSAVALVAAFAVGFSVGMLARAWL